MSMDATEQLARTVWQGQAVEARAFSQREIRAMYESFNRRIWWRNGREYAAAAVASAAFGWGAWQAQGAVQRAGHLLLIAAMAIIVLRLWTRGAARAPTALAAEQSCLEYHRSELRRQRALLQSVWRWYLGPLLPGLAVLYAAHALKAAQHGAGALLVVALGAGVTVAVLVGIGVSNQRAASRLGAQLAALEAES
jgi:hypothetical protein